MKFKDYSGKHLPSLKRCLLVGCGCTLLADSAEPKFSLAQLKLLLATALDDLFDTRAADEAHCRRLFNRIGAPVAE